MNWFTKNFIETLPSVSRFAASLVTSGIACILVATPLIAQGNTAPTAVATNLFSEWGALLTKHVNANGGVDYTGFNKDFTVLEKHLKGYESVDPTGLDESMRKATYINLYNAGMIFNVLKYAKANNLAPDGDAFKKLEINTIRVDGGNIWNGNYRVKLNNKDLNLDEIEHGLLRRQGNKTLDPWKVSTLDPRIHTAVNCAAISCPRVREIAYTGDNVEKLLDENFREYVSSDVQFKKSNESKMQANSIVFWYYEDFDKFGKESLKVAGAGDYLSRYVRPDSSNAAWKIEHFKKNFNDRSKFSLKLTPSFSFEYDWRVNDIANKK